MKKRFTVILPLVFAIVTVLSACSSVDSTATPQSVLSVDTSDMFTDRDMEAGYDEEASAVITLSGDTASCSSNAVQISNSTVTIIDEGTYIISGTLDDGMIIVDAEDTDKVQLVLNGVNITSSDSAAIYVSQANKVFITTASDSENTLENGGEYDQIDDNNTDAVVFSKSDLTLNGSGLLTVNATAGHGIVSKDDLVLTCGTYVINSESHAICGKNSVRIANADYTIVSNSDGIHAENADDTSEGFVYIANGTFDITADGDAISAGAYLLIDNGSFTLESGGGAENASTQSTFEEFGGYSQTSDSSQDDSSSTKGLKAVSDIMINDGAFVIDSADDAIHSNGNIYINGASFEITAGDDGMHADSALTINDGEINISQSYEGIEGMSIDINGGSISLVSSDDGLNASGGNDSSGFEGRGGNMFAETEGAYINIAGGTLYINASGDGVDSNGSLTVSGGETYVSGSTDSGNSALDFNGEAVISGGIFAATGSSGMAENFSSSSTQGVIMLTVDTAQAGSTVALTDSDGNELISWQTEKTYDCIIVSVPEITEGSSYTLTSNGSETQITMSSLVYGSSGGMMNSTNQRNGGMAF